MPDLNQMLNEFNDVKKARRRNGAMPNIANLDPLDEANTEIFQDKISILFGDVKSLSAPFYADRKNGVPFGEVCAGIASPTHIRQFIRGDLDEIKPSFRKNLPQYIALFDAKISHIKAGNHPETFRRRKEKRLKAQPISLGDHVKAVLDDLEAKLLEFHRKEFRGWKLTEAESQTQLNMVECARAVFRVYPQNDQADQQDDEIDS